MDSGLLALTLLVARIGANNPDHSVSADHFAVFADASDTGSNFHDMDK
jgi:hypothetical protein